LPLPERHNQTVKEMHSMASLTRSLAGLIVMAGVLVSAPRPVAAEMEVDLALVLAVDVSRSMDPDEQELQRQGFVEAFRSPLVHGAIQSGVLGRISVTYIEWSGVGDQIVVVPWTVLGMRKDQSSSLSDWPFLLSHESEQPQSLGQSNSA
jgi:hypothetical protein